jgi:hypothetical protein
MLTIILSISFMPAIFSTSGRMTPSSFRPAILPRSSKRHRHRADIWVRARERETRGCRGCPEYASPSYSAHSRRSAGHEERSGPSSSINCGFGCETLDSTAEIQYEIIDPCVPGIESSAGGPGSEVQWQRGSGSAAAAFLAATWRSGREERRPRHLCGLLRCRSGPAPHASPLPSAYVCGY